MRIAVAIVLVTTGCLVCQAAASGAPGGLPGEETQAIAGPAVLYFGWAQLVRLSQDMDAHRKRIALAGAQGLVLKLFQTVGIDKRLPCYPSEDDAVAALAKED